MLLKGINDDIGTMRELMHGLLKLRVKAFPSVPMKMSQSVPEVLA